MQSIIKQLYDFVKFAAKEINLSKLPKIHFVGNKENKFDAFGHSNGHEIFVRITDRHPDDVMRTIAHELIHCKQSSMGKKGEKFKEDEANALAGRIMRKYNTTNPSIFKSQPIKPNVVSETESLMATNSIGSSGPHNPASTIAMPETQLLRAGKMMKRKKLTDIIGSKEMRKELIRRDK